MRVSKPTTKKKDHAPSTVEAEQHANAYIQSKATAKRFTEMAERSRKALLELLAKIGSKKPDGGRLIDTDKYIVQTTVIKSAPYVTDEAVEELLAKKPKLRDQIQEVTISWSLTKIENLHLEGEITDAEMGRLLSRDEHERIGVDAKTE